MRSPPIRAAATFLRAAFLAAVCLLAGCAGLPPASAPSRAALSAQSAFSLEARFSLRSEERNYSGRLSWRHDGAGDELLLASPFGQGIAEISTGAGGARLKTADGQVASAATAEELTRQVLGYPLPIERLVDWVRARDSDEVATRDERARPLELRHEDWRIAYAYDSDDPEAPPSRIFATRADGFELRLRIDEWQLTGEARR